MLCFYYNELCRPSSSSKVLLNIGVSYQRCYLLVMYKDCCLSKICSTGAAIKLITLLAIFAHKYAGQSLVIQLHVVCSFVFLLLRLQRFEFCCGIRYCFQDSPNLRRAIICYFSL